MDGTTTIRQQPAPTLYVIIALKFLKGLSFLSLAMVAFALSNDALPVEYQHWLHYFHLNPERRFWAELAVQIGQLTETRMLWASVGTLVYSPSRWRKGWACCSASIGRAGSPLVNPPSSSPSKSSNSSCALRSSSWWCSG